LYHGSLSRFNNLYIIDNHSTYGAVYQILEKYKKINTFLYSEKKNYLNKGLFMRHLIKDRNTYIYDISYHLDIDEVYSSL